jgi:hypothetical protein
VYYVKEEVLRAEIEASNLLHSDGDIECIVKYFDVLNFTHVTTRGDNMVALMMP